MLSLYLTVTAMVAAVSLVAFVVLGRKARKAKVPCIDSVALERFLQSVTVHEDSQSMPVKCAGPNSRWTYCGIGSDLKSISQKNRRKELCTDHQVEYDKIAEPKVDIESARRFARGSMRAWVLFLTSPIWPIGFLYAFGFMGFKGTKSSVSFWKDVRATAETATPQEIEEDRLLHETKAVMGSAYPKPAIEAKPMPITYDTSREFEPVEWNPRRSEMSKTQPYRETLSAYNDGRMMFREVSHTGHARGVRSKSCLGCYEKAEFQQD